MANQHTKNSEYSNAPGGLDIVWYKENYFVMGVTLPWDVSPYSYEAAVIDRVGALLAAIDVSVTSSGLYSGMLSCTMSGTLIDTLPASSYWHLDQIDSEDRVTTLLGGSFTVKEKGNT